MYLTAMKVQPEQKVAMNTVLTGEDVFIVSLVGSKKFYLPDISFQVFQSEPSVQFLLFRL